MTIPPAGHDGILGTVAFEPLTVYLSLRTGATGLAVAHRNDIARTIEINPTLLVDLDAEGRVLGIESLAGPIGVAALIEILRAVRVADQRANVTDKTEGKFRKRPVVVDARRWDGTASSATPIIDWILGNGQTARYRDTDIGIDTLEGTMSAAPGDWVIRGTAGEFYPCKPDIFADIYEPVTTEEPSRG